MPAIELKGVGFKYRATLDPILEGLDFRVDLGEKVFLHGASGSGKSTVLELMAGILIPSEGRLEILGQSMTTLSASARDHFRANNIGYIFQQFNLIPYLNVRENILLPLHFGKTRSPENSQNLFDHIVEQLDLAPLIGAMVTELSVGQQQRVAVARALIRQPKIILADEPTSALDVDQRSNFLALLFQLCHENKTSLVFVSHDHSLKSSFDRSLDLAEVNHAPSCQGSKERQR